MVKFRSDVLSIFWRSGCGPLVLNAHGAELLDLLDGNSSVDNLADELTSGGLASVSSAPMAAREVVRLAESALLLQQEPVFRTDDEQLKSATLSWLTWDRVQPHVAIRFRPAPEGAPTLDNHLVFVDGAPIAMAILGVDNVLSPSTMLADASAGLKTDIVVFTASDATGLTVVATSQAWWPAPLDDVLALSQALTLAITSQVAAPPGYAALDAMAIEVGSHWNLVPNDPLLETSRGARELSEVADRIVSSPRLFVALDGTRCLVPLAGWHPKDAQILEILHPVEVDAVLLLRPSEGGQATFALGRAASPGPIWVSNRPSCLAARAALAINDMHRSMTPKSPDRSHDLDQELGQRWRNVAARGREFHSVKIAPGQLLAERRLVELESGFEPEVLTQTADDLALALGMPPQPWSHDWGDVPGLRVSMLGFERSPTSITIKIYSEGLTPITWPFVRARAQWDSDLLTPPKFLAAKWSMHLPDGPVRATIAEYRRSTNSEPAVLASYVRACYSDRHRPWAEVALLLLGQHGIGGRGDGSDQLEPHLEVIDNAGRRSFDALGKHPGRADCERSLHWMADVAALGEEDRDHLVQTWADEVAPRVIGGTRHDGTPFVSLYTRPLARW